MHLGWRWFRAVVGATALGWLGLMTGCSSDDEVSGPPEPGPCADMSSEDCPAPPSESPQDEVPPPVDDGTPDDEQDDEEEPPPRPPPPPPGPGSTLWLAREGTPQDDLALDAAVSVDGDVLTLALQGLDDLHTRHPSDDRAQLVLTRRSADGETRWKKSFEVRAPETPVEARVWVSARIASDPTGSIFLAGNAQGLVDLESQDVGDGAFVARLDASGTLLWASRPSGTGLTVVDLAVDAQGRARVAFNSPGTADFGGDTRAQAPWW
ncbi:hypothetical protein ACLESO_41040 [Pyxidicoccus sp. 3LG]